MQVTRIPIEQFVTTLVNEAIACLNSRSVKHKTIHTIDVRGCDNQCRIQTNISPMVLYELYNAIRLILTSKGCNVGIALLDVATPTNGIRRNGVVLDECVFATPAACRSAMQGRSPRSFYFVIQVTRDRRLASVNC